MGFDFFALDIGLEIPLPIPNYGDLVIAVTDQNGNIVEYTLDPDIPYQMNVGTGIGPGYNPDGEPDPGNNSGSSSGGDGGGGDSGSGSGGGVGTGGGSGGGSGGGGSMGGGDCETVHDEQGTTVTCPAP
jgi:hypothetical protein